MARFARPYCATEPVRTVSFFNLYDDIQITGVGRISYALEQLRGGGPGDQVDVRVDHSRELNKALAEAESRSSTLRWRRRFTG